nr:MAG: hypothetical protein [Microvirus sp.]
MKLINSIKKRLLTLRGSEEYKIRLASRGIRLDENGREILDEQPDSLHVPDFESLEATVRRFTSSDMQRFLDAQGMETLDDQDALDLDEDEPDHQFAFEAFKDLTDAELRSQKAKLDAQKAEYDAFQAYLKEKSEKAVSGEVLPPSATPPASKSRPQVERPSQGAGEPVGDDFGG